jgi:hypothetical protein
MRLPACRQCAATTMIATVSVFERVRALMRVEWRRADDTLNP